MGHVSFLLQKVFSFLRGKHDLVEQLMLFVYLICSHYTTEEALTLFWLRPSRIVTLKHVFPGKLAVILTYNVGLTQ